MNRVAWVELTCTAPGPTRTAARRTLLVNASGYACSGNGSNGGIVAVMGASGSGKTTLLTLLAGHAQADAGSIKLNGGPLRSSSVGFLPQFDFLFESLTVLETLRLGSSLRGARLSPSRHDEQDDARLLALLTRLGLAHVVHSRIGQANAAGKRRGISGGERKRCALALALLDAPPLLVLDEPTSGLDARAAVDVLRVLSTLTAEQAVVISLHQPSARAFGLVSQLMLLAPGGRSLFFGAPSRALEHFASLGRPVPSYTNPAEHYIELAADSDDQELQALLLGAADAAATGQSLARTLLEARRGAQDGAIEGAQDGAAASAPPPRRSRRSNSRLQRVSYDDVALDDVAPTPATPERRASVGFVAQLRALHWRATTQNRRHPAFMRAMASRSVMMALIVGHLYSGLGTSQASVQDRTGVLYFVLANQIM
jgi:ATP-binding cassette subfamily G (WHITE) protein 2